MAIFNGTFPIMSGKVEAARAFAKDAMGVWRSEFEEYQKRRGVTRETWSIQETPDGDAFSVVWIESSDPDRSIAEAARDPSDFAVWFHQRVKEINGIDFDAIQSLEGTSELTLDWRG